MAGFPDGVYLETKQGSLGTGRTKSSITFRNYYAVRRDGDRVEMFLLDDDLALTGLRESQDLAGFRERFQYQPQHQDAFDALLPALGPGRPPAEAIPERPPADKAPAPAPPSAPDSPDQTPWWDRTRQGARNLLKGL
jgi:hypothetical protein